MRDTVMAQDLIRQVSGEPGYGEKIKALQERAYQALIKINPTAWTRRRVRTLWEGSTPSVQLREALEMYQAIQDRKRLEDARDEHREFLDHTARLEALLTVTDEAFHSDQIEALRSVSRGMDCPGD